MNVTSSTEGAQALLRPQVTNIPSAFTKTSLWNQIHCVARQITSHRPPTQAQSSRILVLVCFFSPPRPCFQFVRWKLGVKNGCAF